MIRTFFRHILESLKSLRRNGWMTISSISAVTITLSLLGVFLVVIMNTVKLAEDMENNVDVSVWVSKGTDEAGKKDLETQLKAIPNVKTVEFSSQAEELERIKRNFGDVWGLLEQDNPLLDKYVVRASEPQYVKSITESAKKIAKYVDKASYGEDLSDKIFGIAKGVRTWGLIGSVLLLLVAMFLISNTIRITIMSRQREIQIMRLVGAKNGYIRWPFFLEGGWIGLLGAAVPAALMWFGYSKFYGIINPMLMRSNYSILAPQPFTIKVCALLVFMGLMIGSVGSILSMRRFLKV